MIRLILNDQDGNVLSLQNLATAAELQEVVDKARYLIRECERLVAVKYPKAPNPQGGVPYT